ncbi:DEAD/DEAH box helicase family protein [Cellulosimicrobium cellulans]|uniref:DEAD/DEAH box helicase family protein n=1 Tax=Cellulosimicrobium cellulans TaxID=1710 RepID=UPI0020CCD8F2|nr:DEAD/DEAH box helicase family protein [Cellulosimicrobium cellulans]
MSNFEFLRADFPELHRAAVLAERQAAQDLRSSLFRARHALEIALRWAFRADTDLVVPYKNDLAAMIHDPTLRRLAGNDVQAKMEIVRKKGNAAVHEERNPTRKDAEVSLEQLFHVLYWFARTYTPTPGSIAPELRFDVGQVPSPAGLAAARAGTRAEMERLAAEVAQADEALAHERARSTTLEAQVAELQAQVAAAKAANEAVPDTHDYDEATTRDLFIDLLLHEAGWALDADRDREYEVRGMPNQKGTGYVDYVLWGANGLPLAVVEAKRTRRDPIEGRQQAKLYADALEARFGRRPLIYYTNGHEHWMWDDHPTTGYPPRRVAGFRTADELELLISRRSARRDLTATTIDETIAGRYYQTHAIRAVDEAFQKENRREALLVMATGTGKTRTVIALVDQLMKAGWVKRVLFLADRVALVNQAVGAFKENLPSSSPVNLVTDRHAEGRVYVATYPTMMNLIDQKSGESRAFGPGYFDLVIIDEAHRSVYQKYRAIFDWFDSLLVGLTATPKDEVDRNTYELFHLEKGVPTYSYPLEQAVADEYLVPMTAVSVPLKFQREGIRYDDLPEDQKDAWDALEWGEDGPPDEVSADAVNKWLFNADTVDKVLETVMTLGLRVGGGDRLAKTIVFAKNADHANFIAERFDLAYPEHKGEWARVITYRTEYAQSLIDDFSTPGKAPHVAISVDMLDTGIDVPDVANLVFFKIVRSSSKFWQMIGRGTRLRPDLFGPGEDKKEFYVLDFCQNLEYFGQNPGGVEGSTQQSVSQQIFTAQTELLAALSTTEGPADAARTVDDESATTTQAGLRDHLAADLHAKVAGMTLDNFVVRPERRWVETYGEPDAWRSLDAQGARDVVEHLAGLPTAVRDEDEAAKRFDLVLLKLQLGAVDPTLATDRLRRQVQEIASGLLDQTAIPAIAARAELLAGLAGDEWWQDVTLPMLELARRRVRGLVRLLARSKQPIVYTNFEDTLGEFSVVEMGTPQVGVDPERYKEKVRAYLREHEEHTALQKLRRGRQLTATDLAELERMLAESGVGEPEDLAVAAKAANGLGRFVRSLVGMEKSAVNEAFAEFLAGEAYSRDQIDFVRHVVMHLARNGVMDAAVFYDPPFTDVAPMGPEDVFDDGGARVIEIVHSIDATADVSEAS